MEVVQIVSAQWTYAVVCVPEIVWHEFECSSKIRTILHVHLLYHGSNGHVLRTRPIKYLPGYFGLVYHFILISVAACLIAIVYGLSFDLQMAKSVNTNNEHYELYQSNCWNTSLQLRIENELSIDYFDAEYAGRELLNESS